jgi:hypothetical protein
VEASKDRCLDKALTDHCNVISYSALIMQGNQNHFLSLQCRLPFGIDPARRLKSGFIIAISFTIRH